VDAVTLEATDTAALHRADRRVRAALGPRPGSSVRPPGWRGSAGACGTGRPRAAVERSWSSWPRAAPGGGSG
jgi:hypothetical protein